MTGFLKRRVKAILLRSLWAFGADDLVRTLGRLGVRPGDVILVHSSWRVDSGFRGTPAQFIAALVRAVGETGTVAMMNIPFNNMTAAQYLASNPLFDQRRTPSRVGLVTEVFRRSPGVVRSLHPTHSIAARGPGAANFIAGHEDCPTPFSASSPFGKLAQDGGRIVLYDAGIDTVTFTHHIEDTIADRLPVAFYEPAPVAARTIDGQGVERIVPTRVISGALNRARRNGRLASLWLGEGIMREARLGRVRVSCIDAARALACVVERSERGSPFHDTPD